MTKKELTRKRIRMLSKALKPYLTMPEEITFPYLIKKITSSKVGK